MDAVSDPLLAFHQGLLNGANVASKLEETKNLALARHRTELELQFAPRKLEAELRSLNAQAKADEIRLELLSRFGETKAGLDVQISQAQLVNELQEMDNRKMELQARARTRAWDAEYTNLLPDITRNLQGVDAAHSFSNAAQLSRTLGERSLTKDINPKVVEHVSKSLAAAAATEFKWDEIVTDPLTGRVEQIPKKVTLMSLFARAYEGDYAGASREALHRGGISASSFDLGLRAYARQLGDLDWEPAARSGDRSNALSAAINARKGAPAPAASAPAPGTPADPSGDLERARQNAPELFAPKPSADLLNFLTPPAPFQEGEPGKKPKAGETRTF